MMQDDLTIKHDELTWWLKTYAWFHNMPPSPLQHQLFGWGLMQIFIIHHSDKTSPKKESPKTLLNHGPRLGSKNKSKKS